MKKLYLSCFVLCFCASIFAQNDFQVTYNSKTIYYRITSAEMSTVAVTFRGATPTTYREYTTYILIPPTVTYGGVTYLVTSIDANTFYDCTGLDSVSIPNTVTYIDSLAFGGCTILKKCIIPPNVNFIGEKAFSGCTMLPSIDLPSNITKISNGTFMNCSSLTSINIPDMVNIIGERAFLNCISLTSINLPRAVSKIGTSSFFGCINFNYINVDENNPYLMSDSGILYSHAMDTLLLYPPKKAGLEFTTPNSVKSIGDYSLMYITFLKKVNFNNSLERIGTCAFYNATGLAVVHIGDSINYIGEGAFYNCRNLDTIMIKAEEPPCFQSATFYGVPPAVTVAVPCSLVDKYKNSSDWGESFANIQGYDCQVGVNPPDGCSQPENIFPNPVEDNLYINLDTPIERVEVYSLGGNLVILENHFHNKIDMKNLQQGIYLVKIFTNKSVIIKKILKN